MAKLYPFKYHEMSPGIMPMNENLWFQSHQKLLLRIVNTQAGRDLLCIDQNYPHIYQMGKNYVRCALDITSNNRLISISDFRIGAKWANVIRYKWPDFVQYAKRFYDNPKKSLTQIELDGLRQWAATTSTFYPDPDPESTSVDGHTVRSGVSESWATIIAGAGTAAQDSQASVSAPRFSSAAITDEWLNILRAHTLFDTSSMPDTDVISSGTYTITSTATSPHDNFSQSVALISTSPVSNTALAAGDHLSMGTTDFAARIAVGAWATSGDNIFTLNAAGLAAIDATGITKFGMDMSGSVDAIVPTWSASIFALATTTWADTAGTGSDPKLIVVHNGTLQIIMVD